MRPPVSTLCNLNSDTDDAKQHAESNWRQQSQLLMIMTCSNWAEKEEKEANGQEDQQGVDTALDTLWCNMEALPIVVAEPSKDMEVILSMCSGDNSAWVLVWCLHSLNRMLFASNVSDKLWMAELAVVCSAYCKCAELLIVMVGEAEQAHIGYRRRAVERCVALRVSGGDARTAADCFVYNSVCLQSGA